MVSSVVLALGTLRIAAEVALFCGEGFSGIILFCALECLLLWFSRLHFHLFLLGSGNDVTAKDQGGWWHERFFPGCSGNALGTLRSAAEGGFLQGKGGVTDVFLVSVF